MSGQLANKVALVTGGGSGIGRASALALAREGATVVVADVNADGGKETAHQIEVAGGTASYVLTDVTDPVQVEALVATTVERFGRLDCALNNAGISERPVARRPTNIPRTSGIASLRSILKVSGSA